MLASLRLSGALVALFFAALTFGLWAWINRPVDDPGWPERGLQGVTLSPFRAGQDPAEGKFPTAEQIDADLALLSSASVAAVRTYSSRGALAQIPRLAAKHQIKVALGVWLNANAAENEAEIASAIELARNEASVIRLIVGNETLLRGDLTVAELAAHLDRVRAAVRQPVSTAEPWHVWLKHPELAAHVDYLAVHLLPYWEGVSLERAMEHIVDCMNRLEQAFPDKPIVIAEIGWPSDGRMREAAVASPSNQSLFLRRFLRLARQEGYLYYIVEAFDQPWKARTEGTAGAYWGLYNVEREAKFTFVEPIVRVPGWRTLATISVSLAALLLGLFFVHSRTLGTRGRSLLAIVVYGAATALVLVVYDYSQKYLTVASALVGLILILGMLFVIAVMLTETHEWAEAHWATSRRRPFPHALDPGFAPKVSIHVPAYNEPPEMLIETLNALARLEYPDYEVIVVDNNTKDEAVWRPVQTHCEQLGPRFQFFHVSPLAGFKAGALNYALARTAPDADIVAVIDSDYKVDPHWLKDLVPAFADERTAIVQAPQDYRDGDESLFKRMCYAEYRGFFHIGMVTRNERNAIIQHGTMTLVRKSALERVGGWAEWCITEDAELGLRLFEHGHQAQYLPRSYGRGLIPESFLDYKKQRFRWAFGAMQILRAHARALFVPSDARLTNGQRYHFVAGWLPWIADGFNLLFNLGAIAWSVAMLLAPHRIEPPLVMFSLVPLVMFAFRFVKLAHLYVSRVGANVRETLAAAIAGIALAHTVGTAVLKFLFFRSQPFLRTPKHKVQHTLGEIVRAVPQELAMLIALLTCAYALKYSFALGSFRIGIPQELRAPDLSLWIAVLLIQSLPYAAAVLVSAVSALPLPAKWLGGEQPSPIDAAADAENTRASR
jgi:exo-beta-1,3-glucanase (GH17 family)/cellulose synthase/poly-beta-1,6-N-acetylglucosamine synthase-like glycosyltransferase